ncbi:hypothetical protein L1987_48294 [Smallanthus sonchifolius]|uniref:Uncharacterized protein n=1 Tax=Smallanthus sonchifolius TaxID=185202 RepID=A0ACB9FRE0_9ASTR|nr:hypothetical protein L1987_48294 [Smallanthus sonchifolius]
MANLWGETLFSDDDQEEHMANGCVCSYQDRYDDLEDNAVKEDWMKDVVGFFSDNNSVLLKDESDIEVTKGEDNELFGSQGSFEMNEVEVNKNVSGQNGSGVQLEDSSPSKPPGFGGLKFTNSSYGPLEHVRVTSEGFSIKGEKNDAVDSGNLKNKDVYW